MRTVVNETVYGSLLQSYRGSNEVELAGQMSSWYGDVTERYEAELLHVKENIKPTHRGFA